MLGRSSLPDMWFANRLSYSIACPFTFLIEAKVLSRVKVYISVKSCLSSVSFVQFAFGFMVKNLPISRP